MIWCGVHNTPRTNNGVQLLFCGANGNDDVATMTMTAMANKDNKNKNENLTFACATIQWRYNLSQLLSSTVVRRSLFANK